MPLVALTCSTTTSAIQEIVTASRSPMKKPGQRAGQRHAGGRTAQRDRPDGLGQLDVAGVDAAQCRVGVDVDRHEHARRDHDDLHLLADPEPDDRERDEGQRRDRALDLHRPVDERLADPAQPGDQRERHAEHDAEHERDPGPLHRGEQVALQPAVGDQLAERRDHRPRRGRGSAGRGRPVAEPTTQASTSSSGPSASPRVVVPAGPEPAPARGRGASRTSRLADEDGGPRAGRGDGELSHRCGAFRLERAPPRQAPRPR